MKFDLRVRTRFYLAISVTIIVVFILFFLFSPFFHIQYIEVIGNSRITQQEIIERLDIGENAHLLLFNAKEARKRIMENIYIADVEIERVLPGRMYVTITERRLTAYYEHIPGSFLYLDDRGRVLEMKTYFTEPLPVLEGLHFTRFALGEILEVDDTAAFNVIVQYAQLLNQHDLIDQISYINISDAANIRIVAHRIEFNVGGVSDADEKVRSIAAILEAMPNLGLIPGFVDMREIKPEYVLVLLQ